jgi:hypothetical protein
MTSREIVVKIEDREDAATKRKKQKQKQERRNNSRGVPSNGVLLIPAGGDLNIEEVDEDYMQDDVTEEKNSTTALNVKVIPTLDMRGTKESILEGGWRNYKPSQIVTLFRQHYSNLSTLSVMLSRFKNELSRIDPAPPPAFLEKIKLQKKEYAEIRKKQTTVRSKGALNVQVISNADDIVLQALQYLVLNRAELNYAALLILTGLRPIEIMKIAQFKTKLNNQQGNKTGWYACQTRFAKRENMKVQYNECRDRCFLAPYYLIEIALKRVRSKWPCKHLTNLQVNRKYQTQLGRIVTKSYPQWPGITARLCRRFFGVYSYTYFGRSGFFHEGSSQASLAGHVHWHLGHAVLGDEVIAYQSLVIRPKPALKLFEVGRNLRIKSTKSNRTPKKLKTEPSLPLLEHTPTGT